MSLPEIIHDHLRLFGPLDAVALQGDLDLLRRTTRPEIPQASTGQIIEALRALERDELAIHDGGEWCWKPRKVSAGQKGLF
jgi:hypothetical protein